MQGRNNEDELARRRALRSRGGAGPEEPGEEEMPKFGWKDIIAMTLAAYQVLLPVILLMFGALGVVYLLFKWFFT